MLDQHDQDLTLIFHNPKWREPMFSEKDLQTLLDYSAESQVLSLYLNTDPTQVNTEAAKLRLRNWLKKIDLPKDVQAVEDYVNLEYDWSARSLVIFSDQKAGFFETYQFNLDVPDKVHVGSQLLLRPLVRLLDVFSGWSVVLVDKQGARLFSFNLGELGEMSGVSGEEVKQAKRGGGNAMPGRMGGADLSGKVENIIEHNIREVIEYATNFFTQNHIRRIMIGGTDDNVARFKDALPKSWQSLVVGFFSMSMNAGDAEVLEQAEAEALAAQKKNNQSLVEQAITLAAKGSHGVTGLNESLNAIHEGRVKTLLVDQDFEQEGFRCMGCGYLTTQELDDCPFCSGQFERINSAVEMAVRETLQNNADVKVLTENEQLESAGRIAAILRY
jgi:peptide chain release factor subunit 1